MSLINKMLKDLEARRKKSSNKQAKGSLNEKINTPSQQKIEPTDKPTGMPGLTPAPNPQKKSATKPRGKELIEKPTKNIKLDPTVNKIAEKTSASKTNNKSPQADPKTPAKAKQTFTLGNSINKTNSSKKSKQIKKSIAIKQPPILDNQTLKSSKNRSWARYTSTTFLIIVLITLIVALVFSTIAFHARWKNKKIPTKKAVAQQKILKHSKAVAAGMQTYQNQHRLNGEAKKAIVAANPSIIRKQAAQHRAVREKTNQITATLLNRTKPSISITPPLGKTGISKKTIATTKIIIKKILSPTKQAEKNYQAAISQSQSGSTSDAIKQFQAILAKTPDYKPARLALAITLIKQEKTQKAQIVLSTGLQQNPSYTPYAELQAHILAQHNQVPEALAILSKAKPASISSNPNYFAFMAALYLQQAQYQHAAALYQQLTIFNAKKADWWAGLSISMQKSDQTEKAQQAYERAKEAGNLSPELAEYLQK